MLGQAISMVLPQVVGYKIYGDLDSMSTSTDVVLTITKVRLLTVIMEAVRDSERQWEAVRGGGRQ